jgi:hypothetical protein
MSALSLPAASGPPGLDVSALAGEGTDFWLQSLPGAAC